MVSLLHGNEDERLSEQFNIYLLRVLFNWLDQKVYTCVNLFDDVRIVRAQIEL